jgi:hypothetical protein
MKAFCAIACGLGLSGSAVAADIEWGIGVDLAIDLGDPGLNQGGAKMAPGPVLRAPIRWSPHPVVSLRADPFFGLHSGQDRVEWTQFDGNIRYASEDHWTLLTQFGVTVGPEVSPWPNAKVSPYAGSQLGFAWAQHWHSFKGASAIILDPQENDVSSGSNIDPYTSQIVPTVGFHTGIRIHDVLPFAIEAELGYNVAFMRRASLKKARPGLDATRAAYGFNPIRIGINAVFVH